MGRKYNRAKEHEIYDSRATAYVNNAPARCRHLPGRSARKYLMMKAPSRP
jgi:hypothetical protein